MGHHDTSLHAATVTVVLLMAVTSAWAATEKAATRPAGTKLPVLRGKPDWMDVDRTKLAPEAVADHAADKPWAKALDRPTVSPRQACPFLKKDNLPGGA